MQLIRGPSDSQRPKVEAAIHPERLIRYLPAAGKDKTAAFDYYLWNCLLCESFHLSLHFAEIVCRNGLHKGLAARCGAGWHRHVVFRKLLDPRFSGELDAAVAKESAQHGVRLTANHVVSALTFGFWEHLTTKRFERFLWAKGIGNVFPGAPAAMRLADLHALIESVRLWRNRIAHIGPSSTKGRCENIRTPSD